jgi:hypothetical protein
MKQENYTWVRKQTKINKNKQTKAKKKHTHTYWCTNPGSQVTVRIILYGGP